MILDSIKYICNERNVSLKELSEKCGLEYISLIRSFRNNAIHLKSLEKICDYLGISPWIFINNESLTNLDKSAIVLTTMTNLKAGDIVAIIKYFIHSFNHEEILCFIEDECLKAKYNLHRNRKNAQKRQNNN